MDFGAYGPALTEPVTLDEYMAVLQQRLDTYNASRPPSDNQVFRVKSWVEPLLPWFFRDEDEAFVVLPEPKQPKPKPKPKPRYYRPASYWREKLARIEAQMKPLEEPLITDRAAAGGCALGPKRTQRIQNQEDGRLQRYVALKKERDRLASMLRTAEAREAKALESASAATERA